MAEVINMPRLSDTMEEGVISKWLKKVGDPIKEGDILAEIETDKATMEFESFSSGILLHIGVGEGQSIPVNQLIAIIGEKDEDISALISEANTPKTKEAPQQEPSNESITKLDTTAKTTLSKDSERIKASPLAKKIAKEKHINLAQVSGSGDGGRIVKKDIEHLSENPSSSPVQPMVGESITEVANSQMRKIIAKRLTESKTNVPHYYLSVDVDMDNAINYRKEINEHLTDSKISFNDIVTKCVAIALKQHPTINSIWTDEKTLLNHHVHIGIAVAIQDGLVVPVIKHADQLSYVQISEQVKDLAKKAKDKKLIPSKMEGSTFTISNLGMFGITSFTSIINQPNSAILSVGAIIQKPVVKNSEITIGNVMTLNLACDHRTIDGAAGAQFLNSVKKYIEQPILMLT